MKLEFGLYGTHTETLEQIVPNAPISVVQSDEDECIISLGNLVSEHYLPSRIIISRDQHGWFLEIRHEGDEVCRVELPAGADAKVEGLAS